MELYAYTSVSSFIRGCERRMFGLPVLNFLYCLPDKERIYGLSLLWRAIRLYEARDGINDGQSIQAIPFFRANRRKLVGSPLDLYVFSLFEEKPAVSAFRPDGEPIVCLTLDCEALSEYCLLENYQLLRCQYDEEANVAYFVSQLEVEYDKFFYGTEHTDFTRDSNFFSLLCKACPEFCERLKRGNRNVVWRGCWKSEVVLGR